MLNTFKTILKWFPVFIYSIHCNRLHRLMGRNGNARNFCMHYTVALFTDQNWISKTVYHIPWSYEVKLSNIKHQSRLKVLQDCMRCVMVCKIGFTNWNTKITLLRSSMVVTCYIKLFQTGANRHNGILMSLFLLVAETITFEVSCI